MKPDSKFCISQVKYVGRTRQNLLDRLKQHERTDTLKNGLRIRAVEFEGKTLEGLTHAEARGLEHLVYKKYKDLGKNLLNKINPLDLSTKVKAGKAARYLEAASEFLKRVIP